MQYQMFSGEQFLKLQTLNANNVQGFDYTNGSQVIDVSPLSGTKITQDIIPDNGQAHFLEFSVDAQNAVAYQNADDIVAQGRQPGSATLTTTWTLISINDTGAVNVVETQSSTDSNIVVEPDKTYTLQQTGYSDSTGTYFYAPGDGAPGVYEKFLNLPETPTIPANDTVTLNTDIADSDVGNDISSYDNSKNLIQTTTLTSTGSNFSSAQYDTSVSACFVSGTHILTSEGAVCVENLQVGNLLVTASGALRPIKWIGSHHIHRMPQRATLAAKLVWPIRITQNAFAPDVPNRDLLVSPGHALAVDVMGLVFIQAEKLVNGTTIRQEPCSSLTYWHVELETHDVIISNNLTSESYLDVGNRAVLGLVSLSAPATLADYAYPLIESGPVIKAIRARLDARALTLGWHQTQNDDMHLLVDGQRLEPVISDKRVCFIFPTSAQNVQLVSHTFSPAEGSRSNDHRHLGVNMSDVQLTDGFGCRNTLSLDHPALANQFHVEEARDGATWRWTQGLLKLPPSLWAECEGHAIFTFTKRIMSGKYWSAPVGEIKNITKFRKKA